MDFPSFDNLSPSGLIDPIPQSLSRATPFIFTNAAGKMLHVEDLAVSERAALRITYYDTDSTLGLEPYLFSPPRSLSCSKTKGHADLLAPRLFAVSPQVRLSVVFRRVGDAFGRSRFMFGHVGGTSRRMGIISEGHGQCP